MRSIVVVSVVMSSYRGHRGHSNHVSRGKGHAAICRIGYKICNVIQTRTHTHTNTYTYTHTITQQTHTNTHKNTHIIY